MENIKMKTNIYQKLHKAACEAGGVAKGKKVQGMMFNPLLHDDVQRVAMEALLSNGLYPVCTYTNELTESFILVTCHMKIYDIDNPTDFIEVNGCSAMGNLDKFGTGNGMSYAKKYAYLNALHLKTGLDNEDGYKTEPFKKIPQKTSGTGHVNKKVDVEKIKSDLKNAQHLPRLNYLVQTVHKNSIDFLLKNSLRDYRQIDDIAKTREHQLTQQGAM